MAFVFFIKIDGFFFFATGDLDLLESFPYFLDDGRGGDDAPTDDPRVGSGELVVYGDGPGDTAAFEYSRAEVAQTATRDGKVLIQDAEGGNLAFLGLERLELEDGTWLYDLDPREVEDLYALYGAAFGRTPDEDGLRFWADAVGDGAVAEAALAEIFVASEEFAQLYGADPTGGSLVTALYENVLDRAPDREGYGFWTDALATGQLTEADMLEAFAFSEENLAQVADDIDPGVWVV